MKQLCIDRWLFSCEQCETRSLTTW